MDEQSARFISQACYVKIFKGFNTAGLPVFTQTCICPECLGRTAPIHTPLPEENDERGKS